MATNNIKIFDENKSNMLTNEAYGVNSQRLNGVQQGIASSQLQNKTLYQVSLVAYAIGQMMQANGYDANDELAVTAFCDNMSKSIMQKVLDLVSVDDVTNFADVKQYINPATWKVAYDYMKADTELIQVGTDDTHYVTPKGVGIAGTKFVSQWLSNNYYYNTVNLSSSSSGYTRTFNIKASIEIHICIVCITTSRGSSLGSMAAIIGYGETKYMRLSNDVNDITLALSDFNEGKPATLTITFTSYFSGFTVSVFAI